MPGGRLGRLRTEREDSRDRRATAAQEERTARRTRRRAGEPYQSVTQLQRVDRLDAPGGRPEPADVEWLVRTASLGPEVISEAATAGAGRARAGPAGAVGTRQAAQAVLRPAHRRGARAGDDNGAVAACEPGRGRGDSRPASCSSPQGRRRGRVHHRPGCSLRRRTSRAT